MKQQQKRLMTAVFLCLILLGGTGLLLEASRTFATSNGREALSFGYGLPVQLVDPAGRNSVEFMSYEAPLTASLQLYALSTEQFISMYNSLPADSWQESDLDPTGLSLVAEWQEVVTDSYVLSEASLPGVSAGFYLLTLGDAETSVQDEMLVVLSGDVLLLKASAIGNQSEVVAWASELSTGQPLSGTAISIYNNEGQLLDSGVTDEEGLYVTDVGDADPNSLIAVGTTEGGAGEPARMLTACGTRPEWNSRSSSAGVSEVGAHKVYLYTDRPIYRPSHTVHYKGILRHDDDAAYTPLATTQPVTVSVRDARNNVVSTASLSPSHFGTISGSFTLADEPSLGEYQLELLLDGDTYRQSFKVEEYRKPEYAVTVSTEDSYYVSGDLITVTVAADYYFGQPVAEASVDFVLYKRSNSYGSNYPAWRTTGTTDEQGRWVTVINSADYASRDSTFTFKATVSDESNLESQGESRVPVYYTEYGLTTSLDKYGYEPGESISVTLRAEGRDGSPVVGEPLSVSALSWRNGSYQEVTSTLGTTDELGEARVAFQIPTTGWYRLEAQGRDERGRTVTARNWFWVYRHDWGWGYEYEAEDEITISADKDSYAPGEIAQLLVRSPVTGTALLSLERGRTHDQYPIFLSDTVTLLSLPIEAEYAPNVFATISIFQPGWEPEGWYGEESTPEGRLLLDSTELVVPVTDKTLQVELVPDKTTYQPRDDVTFSVQVKDERGNPVVAEVSLGLVDEAIYALSEELSADIHETFYGPRAHSVVTYDSLHPKKFIEVLIPTGGDPTGPIPTPAPTAPDEGAEDDGVRRNFPDTAYWQPSFVTDEAGQATITLTLPDNLTRWRALARAVSMDTLVGEAMTAITVTQELIVRPVLPRFLIQGDVVQLRTVAHNYSTNEVTATMALSASGMVLLDSDPSARPLSVGDTTTADWSAVASQLGQGSVLARLSTDAGSDAVELPLPIYPFAIPEVTTRVGRVENKIVETIYLSTTAIPEATSLEIHPSSSIALGLVDGLEYLIDYPYG